MAMTDEQLARAVHGAGMMTRDQLIEAGRARQPGENLAATLLRLNAIPLGELMRLDPLALDHLSSTNGNGASTNGSSTNGSSTSGNGAKPSSTKGATGGAGYTQDGVELGLGIEKPVDLEGEFHIEGSRDEGNDDPAQAPVVRWANELLKLAINMGASDVHLEPQPNGLLPRYRVDGRLRSGNTLPIDISLPLVSRFKVLADLDITEQRLPQDGRFRAKAGKRSYDFRVSSLPGIHGEKIVLRLLDHSSLVTDLGRLGFSHRDREVFGTMLQRSHGMILVTGPTGSGKTTTLYGALASARDDTKNVITVEDPVEYELSGVTQTSINSEIGLTFARALRAILRQDPDVILVGEIRDEETADVAVRAALTGHLLLSTLHTNSAVAAITRLQDMGVPAYLIASSLAGVLAQRLVRLNCRHCRALVPADAPEREDWAQFFDIDPDAQLWKGAGCAQCGGTGSKGRAAVMELMEIGAGVRKAIARKSNVDELRQAARQEGMRMLRDDARDKVLAGYIAPDEGMRALMGQEE